MNSSVKGREKSWIKKVPSQAKSIGTFLYLEKDRNNIDQNFSLQEPCRFPLAFSHWDTPIKRNKAMELLDGYNRFLQLLQIIIHYSAQHIESMHLVIARVMLFA